MEIKKPIIYLDNNATTPTDPRVLETMMPYLTSNFANANSTHLFGIDAYNAVKKARNQVAELIGAETKEIVFTSGAVPSVSAEVVVSSEQVAPAFPPPNNLLKRWPVWPVFTSGASPRRC